MKKLIDHAINEMEKESWKDYEEKIIRINVVKDGIGISRSFNTYNTRFDDTSNARMKDTATKAINAFSKFKGAKVEVYEIEMKIKRVQ